MQTKPNLFLSQLTPTDIPFIVAAFANIGWNKPTSLFETYLQEQQHNQRICWIAQLDGQCAGYVTLKWQSPYQPFAEQHIPEIMDLNVLPHMRGCGIGSALLLQAETEAATKHTTVGLGVGLYGGPDGGYGPAQRLYVKRGYIPDGKGVTYNYASAIPGNNYSLDDELILWLTKQLL